MSIEKGSTEHAALAFLAALLDTGRTSVEILAALDVITEAAMIGTSYLYEREDGTQEVLDPKRLKIVMVNKVPP